jgi:hypothetical protein
LGRSLTIRQDGRTVFPGSPAGNPRQDFFPGSLAGFWVRIRFFFKILSRKKNPAGQEYEIPAGNSCRDFLVIPAVGISCRAAGKNGPARLLRNGLKGTA